MKRWNDQMEIHSSEERDEKIERSNQSEESSPTSYLKWKYRQKVNDFKKWHGKDQIYMRKHGSTMEKFN